MKKFSFLILLLIALLFVNCSGEKHFITDNNYRLEVDKQFEVRRKLAHFRDKELFGVFNNKISLEKQEALKFLYAYMPLSDLADYDGEYFLQQVDLSFQARSTFNWCNEIPEDIFRHFVLPIRVNNENLDTSRIVFFNELKSRVINLSMNEAALEVNHWCHEKVNYRSSDVRTSSPLASVRTSFGRCGEESTFTVAAMRSVGIPARQVYTPRWAHTDDNHAWVEVFVDSKWQYLGACEPEAILNKGWFDVPVKRAMMVHTNVIGKYSGNENILEQNELYTKINSLSSYTITQSIIVKVLDAKQNPLPDARIEFRIYNYAEFYPMVVALSDANGFATLQTGLGDLQIWVSKDSLYGYTNVSVGSIDTVYIKLNRMPGETYTEIIENVPPIEKLVESLPVARQEENNRRLSHEDSIRNAYMSTFMKPDEAESMAIELNMDTAQVQKLIALSYGNCHEVASYMRLNSTKPLMLDLLQAIAEKDLRDTPAIYLNDHLNNVNTYFKELSFKTDSINEPSTDKKDDIFNEGILSARILNELIKPWRSYLQSKFNKNFALKAQTNAGVIIKWINDSITVNKVDNYMGCPISPIGVYQMRVADKRSRDIFFVALCRSLFIPARIDPATLIPQVYKAGGWSNVSFETIEAPVKSALLVLTNDESNPIFPEYSIHYTLQKFNDGHFTTLDYEGSSLFNKFPAAIELEPGYYLLMTGHRRDDGSVLTRSDYFTLKKNDHLSMPIILQPLEKVINVVGILDMNQPIKGSGNKNRTVKQIAETDYANTLKSLAGNKGLVIAFINPANEPTRHVMNDIPALKADFDKWNGNFIFIVPTGIKSKDFNPSSYKNLPTACNFINDEHDKLLNSVMHSVGLKSMPPLPFVIFVNSSGEITFTSSGYRIGIGENLLKATR